MLLTAASAARGLLLKPLGTAKTESGKVWRLTSVISVVICRPAIVNVCLTGTPL
jgi:hypothetical protein